MIKPVQLPVDGIPRDPVVQIGISEADAVRLLGVPHLAEESGAYPGPVLIWGFEVSGACAVAVFHRRLKALDLHMRRENLEPVLTELGRPTVLWVAP